MVATPSLVIPGSFRGISAVSTLNTHSSYLLGLEVDLSWKELGIKRETSPEGNSLPEVIL